MFHAFKANHGDDMQQSGWQLATLKNRGGHPCSSGSLTAIRFKGYGLWVPGWTNLVSGVPGTADCVALPQTGVWLWGG